MSATVTGRVLRNVRRDFVTGRLPAKLTRGIRVASALSVLGFAPGLSGCIIGSERPALNLDMPAAYREGFRGAPDAAFGRGLVARVPFR
jgi:hypothetical protein